jgi:hypothetical protein
MVPVTGTVGPSGVSTVRGSAELAWRGTVKATTRIEETGGTSTYWVRPTSRFSSSSYFSHSKVSVVKPSTIGASGVPPTIWASGNIPRTARECQHPACESPQLRYGCRRLTLLRRCIGARHPEPNQPEA